MARRWDDEYKLISDRLHDAGHDVGRIVEQLRNYHDMIAKASLLKLQCAGRVWLIRKVESDDQDERTAWDKRVKILARASPAAMLYSCNRFQLDL